VLSDSSSRGFAKSVRRRGGSTTLSLHNHLRVEFRVGDTSCARAHEPRRCFGEVESGSGIEYALTVLPIANCRLPIGDGKLNWQLKIGNWQYLDEPTSLQRA